MIAIPPILASQRFILTREKSPTEQDWNDTKNYPIDNPYFQKYLKFNSSYGVLCGFNNLVVFDVDQPQVLEETLKIPIFQDTFTVKTAGKGLFHYYFYCDEAKTIRIIDKEGNTLVDLQGKGTQVIGAGSIMSNGKKYEIVNDKPIQYIKYEELKSIACKFGIVKAEEKKEEKKLVTSNTSNSNDLIIEQIKNRVKVPDILSRQGISIKKNPTDCPFHSSKGGKCFSFTAELWHCFHCLESGDIFHLVQKIENIGFNEAKTWLMDAFSISADKKMPKEQEEHKALSEYKEINIKKFAIHKSKDETIYKIYICDFYLTILPDKILNADDFRKKFFNETGRLLGNIKNQDWIKLVNDWVATKGEILDNIKDTNTNENILETIISEIQAFAVVISPVDAVSYGRLLVSQDDPLEENYIFVYNKVFDVILRKNNFKMNMSQLKVLLDDYIVGKTKVFRYGKKTGRFFRLDKSKLPDLVVKLPEKVEVEKKCEEENDDN